MEYVAAQGDAADQIVAARLTDQVLNSDDQRTGARAAMGDVKALQSAVSSNRLTLPPSPGFVQKLGRLIKDHLLQVGGGIHGYLAGEGREIAVT